MRRTGKKKGGEVIAEVLENYVPETQRTILANHLQLMCDHDGVRTEVRKAARELCAAIDPTFINRQPALPVEGRRVPGKPCIES